MTGFEAGFEVVLGRFISVSKTPGYQVYVSYYLSLISAVVQAFVTQRLCSQDYTLTPRLFQVPISPPAPRIKVRFGRNFLLYFEMSASGPFRLEESAVDFGCQRLSGMQSARQTFPSPTPLALDLCSLKADKHGLDIFLCSIFFMC